MQPLFKCARDATSIIAKVMGVLTFAIVFFVGVVTFHSLFDTKPPIIYKHEAVEVTKERTHIMLLFRARIDVDRQFNAHIHRYILYNKTGRTIILPESSLIYRPGKDQIVEKLFYVPADLSEGEWCLHTLLTWRPSLSIVSHSHEFLPACFRV